jgi:phosphate:Na+ symporter
MVDLVDEAYAVMIENLNAYYSGNLDEIRNAYDAEDRINVMRNNLREQAIEEVEGGDSTSYLTSVYYLDIVSELEKMGDFMINVSQDLYKCKLKISQL